jgi:hypothetical protein
MGIENDYNAYYTVIVMKSKSSATVSLNLPDTIEEGNTFLRITRVSGRSTSTLNACHIHCKELSSEKMYNSYTGTYDMLSCNCSLGTSTNNFFFAIAENSLGVPISPSLISNPNVTFYLTDETFTQIADASITYVEIEVAIWKKRQV